MTKKIKAVLFDFDGTLMNTNDIIIGSWQHTFRCMEGKERPLDDIVRSFGEPLYETMEKYFPGEDPADMVAIYRKYQQEIYQEKIHMFPGMEALLAQLKERGYLLAIVTSRLWQTTSMGLYDFDIAHLFDAVVSAEDTPLHKPDPAPCLICLEKLGVQPEEALFVGDSKFDVLCAKNAGVPSVLVSWTLCVSPEEQEGLYKPDYLMDEPQDLLAILESLEEDR